MKVIAFVPLPPPFAGPEIATQAMLDVLSLPPDCELRVVKANVRVSNDKKGNFDGQGILCASKSLFNLFFTCLCFRPQKVYLLINQSKAGFLRDTVAIFISKLFFCKVIGHYHGGRFHHFYETSSLWYRFLIRRALSLLDKMIVQAERLKIIFSKLLPESRIFVLYNGLSEESFERGQYGLDLRKKKKRDCPTFLFLGHISFTKGFYELMNAYKKLLAQGKKVRLLVAGDFILNPKTQAEFLDEPYRRFYRNHHSEIHREMLDFVSHHRSSGVEYHGLVTGEQKYRLFEEADVLILPSFTEGFPNVILEAMAFGLALAVTPVGVLPEILNEPNNALFVTVGDAGSLARGMERLAEDPSLCFSMGMNNRELVLQKYRMQFIGKQFRDFIFKQEGIFN